MTRTLGQLVRWGIRAVGGLAVNIILLTFWVEYVGLAEWLAIIPNWVILSVTMYAVTDKWVFAGFESASSLAGHVKQFAGSESIMLAAKGLNYAIYLGLLSLIDYRLAWIVGAVISFGVTFLGNRWWWARRDYSTST